MCCTNGVTTVSCGPLRMAHEHIHACIVRIHVALALAEFAVLIHLRAVVGRKDDDGLVQQPVVGEVIQEHADPFIYERN